MLRLERPRLEPEPRFQDGGTTQNGREGRQGLVSDSYLWLLLLGCWPCQNSFEVRYDILVPGRGYMQASGPLWGSGFCLTHQAFPSFIPQYCQVFGKSKGRGGCLGVLSPQAQEHHIWDKVQVYPSAQSMSSWLAGEDASLSLEAEARQG